LIEQDYFTVEQFATFKGVTERPSGYFLDGRPVNLTEIMREVNRMRATIGVEQIVSNSGSKV